MRLPAIKGFRHRAVPTVGSNRVFRVSDEGGCRSARMRRGPLRRYGPMPIPAFGRPQHVRCADAQDAHAPMSSLSPLSRNNGLKGRDRRPTAMTGSGGRWPALQMRRVPDARRVRIRAGISGCPNSRGKFVGCPVETIVHPYELGDIFYPDASSEERTRCSRTAGHAR